MFIETYHIALYMIYAKKRDSKRVHKRIYSTEKTRRNISEETNTKNIFKLQIGEKTNWSFCKFQKDIDLRLQQKRCKVRLKLWIENKQTQTPRYISSKKEFIIISIKEGRLKNIPQKFAGYIVELLRVS